MNRQAFNFLKNLSGRRQASMKQCLTDAYHINALRQVAVANAFQVRKASSAPSRVFLSENDKSWLAQRMVKTRLRLGMTEKSKAYYRARGLVFFETIEGVDWKEYFQTFQMPDTFHSWFLVMELHIWMLSVRAKTEGKAGELVSKFVIEHMWEEALKRAKKLESYSSSALRESFAILHEEFLGAFLMYDHGLLNSDVDLADAVWCRFLEENCDDPEKVELLVKHIRKQIQLLHNISKDDFLSKAEVTWLPLSDKR